MAQCILLTSVLTTPIFGQSPFQTPYNPDLTSIGIEDVWSSYQFMGPHSPRGLSSLTEIIESLEFG